jgi:hypothetical protein
LAKLNGFLPSRPVDENEVGIIYKQRGFGEQPDYHPFIIALEGQS